MQKRTKIIFIILGCLIAIYLYTHFSSYLSRRTHLETVTVAVSTVEQKNVAVPLQSIGTVQAYSIVSVKSLVDGQLLAVGFKEGDFVKKGQMLFQIDPRPFQAQLQQAQANLARDQAQLANAHVQVERSRALAKKGYLSAQDYDQLIANEKALTATIQADQAAITTAQLQLTYATITSPVDGHTGNLLVYPGNIIKTASSTELVRITQINPIYVEFSVPQQYLTAIQTQSAKAPITIKAMIGTETEIGRLTFIDNTIDTATGTIQLKATFANPKQRLWPGQFVTVVLPQATLPHAILVPTRAVQVGQSGAYVYVIKDDKTASYRQVKTGPLIDNNTIILQGLKPGERVVTDGQMRLTEGTPVKVEQMLPSNADSTSS